MTPSNQGLGTRNIVQIGIIVDDIAARAQAWSAILGLPEPETITTGTYELARTEYAGAPSTARAKLAFFHLDHIDIELIEPIDEPSTWRDQLNQHGASLHHIAFRIHGMPEKLAYLEHHGAQLIQRGEYTGGRYAYVDAVAQLGTIVELLEND